jgi:hypothetical protein
VATQIPQSVREAEAAALRALYDAQEPRIGHLAFAKANGIGTTAAAVAHYLHNRRPLNLDAATRFASSLNIPIARFSPRLAAAAAKARSAGGAHMAVVVDATAVLAKETAPTTEWPLERIDLAAVLKMKRRDQMRLQDAWLAAAAAIGLHVDKQAAA